MARRERSGGKHREVGLRLPLVVCEVHFLRFPKKSIAYSIVPPAITTVPMAITKVKLKIVITCFCPPFSEKKANLKSLWEL